MYEGDKSCKALKVTIETLNFMRSVIGNQCRSFKMGRGVVVFRGKCYYKSGGILYIL